MPAKLSGLSVREVSGVDAAANRRKFLLSKAAEPTKTEGGQNFKRSDYAYAPDPKEPSTWKLRLVEKPGGAPTAAQVGRAIAALGKGFRGQKVSIPDSDRAKVKAKVLAAWRKTHPGEKDIPDVLKGATMPKPNAVALALAKRLQPIKKGLPAKVQALLEELNDTADEAGDETPELVDYVEDQESDEQLDDLCEALAEALDDVLDSETVEDKREAVAALLEQFQEALGAGGLLKAAGLLKVTKAGRKISSNNLAILQQIDALLGQLITQAGGNPASADQQDEEEADEDQGADDGQDQGDVGEDEDEDGDEVAMARKAAKDKRAARKAEREKKRAGKKEEGMKKSAEVVSLEKRVAEAERIAKEEREIREKGEYLAKARSIGPVLGLTVEKMRDQLYALSKSNPSLAADIERQWRAAAEQMRQSSLFGEVGKSAQGGAPDASSMMIAKAQEIAKRDSIGLADAMTKASKEDPALFAEYVNSQRKGA